MSDLDVFAFLIGKWKGTGTTKGPDGNPVQFNLTWIGRYILDGTAIADEFHSLAPDGSPFLGISFRCFDARSRSWIVEYLNVSHSILRKQVNPRSGSVSVEGDTVIVISEDEQSRIREHYRVVDSNHFTYRTDLSRDEGRTWDPPLFEMWMERVT